MPHHHIDDDFSKARGIDNHLDWLVMTHFGELIDNDKYQVIAVLFLICQNWQIRDKIYQ